MELSDMAEIVLVISATDIEKNKVRGDLGITYDVDVLRLIGEFERRGLLVSSVVITGRRARSSLKTGWKKRISASICIT